MITALRAASRAPVITQEKHNEVKIIKLPERELYKGQCQGQPVSPATSRGYHCAPPPKELQFVGSVLHQEMEPQLPAPCLGHHQHLQLPTLVCIEADGKNTRPGYKLTLVSIICLQMLKITYFNRRTH